MKKVFAIIVSSIAFLALLSATEESYGIIDRFQCMRVQNYSDLSTLPSLEGDIAYSKDSKSTYFFNGTNWLLQNNGNLTPPTAVAGTGAGAGAVITLSGNSRTGLITLKQGAGGTAGGQIMVLTLPPGVSYANSMTITFAPCNQNFATLLPLLSVPVTQNTATLNFTGVALTANAEYKGQYQIDGF